MSFRRGVSATTADPGTGEVTHDPLRMAKRCVIYARYSSDQQDETSIEVQIQECRKYAQSRGITVVHEPYVDAAQSGTATLQRSAYQRLLADAFSKTRDFDLIVVFHSSRWGRGMDSEIDEFLLEKRGVKIISTHTAGDYRRFPRIISSKGIIRKIDAYYSLQLSRYTHVYQSDNAPERIQQRRQDY